MPRRFQFPSQSTQVWQPHTAFPQWPKKKNTRYSNLWSVVGRLNAGASVQQAQAEMSVIASGLRQQYPDSHEGLGVNVVPLEIQVTGKTLRATLWMLLAAAVFVLLISCVNVAHLLLAEGASRRKELAVRTRLVRQLLSESLLLSAAASALGVVFAVGGLPALVALAPPDFPRLNEVGINEEILAFRSMLAILTAVLFGLPPALKASASDPGAWLREGTRGASQGSTGRRLHGALATIEIALAAVLLNGAGLLLRSFDNLNRIDPGFRTENTLSLRVAPRKSFTRLQRLSFYRRLIEEVEALPGVVSAGPSDGEKGTTPDL